MISLMCQLCTCDAFDAKDRVILINLILFLKCLVSALHATVYIDFMIVMILPNILVILSILQLYIAIISKLYQKSAKIHHFQLILSESVFRSL